MSPNTIMSVRENRTHLDGLNQTNPFDSKCLFWIYDQYEMILHTQSIVGFSHGSYW